ncbi:MAG: MBL fold metallo-hydrolase [Gammaproteobacteria bacterium]
MKKSLNSLLRGARVDRKRWSALIAASLFMTGSLGACAANTPAAETAASAVPSAATANVFVTLGTNGGPVAEVGHAQPANALQVGRDVYLIDAGDGAAGQLIGAGFQLQQVQAVFLSHLHFDHTGGVLALLGSRIQTNTRSLLTIYGPPGTKDFVEGLLASMAPVMEAAYGMPGKSWQTKVEAKELIDGDIIELKDLTVTTAQNSHFAIPQSDTTPEKAKSLSFRFDLANRSIVYTGDTGPSANVEKLAKGADLLVSEMMDIPVVLERARVYLPNAPEQVFVSMEWHFRAHHLTPVQVGELAAAAGVGEVVITHQAPKIATDDHKKKILDGVRSAFDGPVVLARDLDRY